MLLFLAHRDIVYGLESQLCFGLSLM